ncbi:hypothetical protein P691DRAFT_729758 [Macrolepiota fuliginosa MF-IS2]|uniref:Exonuclease domain-containing protein n=1 Tax=Macrolepiota fuliginosa MF-IS2 TaxID=1400762 RepID=A0A9P5XC74_9AGAR|nr:hypothetical protein P691DRAFT_729758 [Macrolepiota fuliginosa MF-IS2]
MRYTPLPPDPLPDINYHPQQPPAKVQQPYDALLILDVEATCFQGTDFNYPNEIIEFPICLMKWQDRDRTMQASKLHVVDEFRSFVRPTWRPTLSAFCTELTSITQDQVDSAPLFPQVLKSVRAFLVKNGLIDGTTGRRLIRFCWCSDGPFDIRDFVAKQCFISKIPVPEWLTGDVLDVRMAVMQWLSTQPSHPTNNPSTNTRTFFPPVRRSLNIPAQLNALGLPTFQGRQHCGIDDTRNIAKIVTELGKRGVTLKPNTQIKPGRKWVWMGKGGEVLEQFCASFDEHGHLARLPAVSPPSSPPHAYTFSAPPSPSLSYATAATAFSPVYSFGTATRPASPAFWSPPRRPDSPMSIVSSSPESESEIGVRITKPPRPITPITGVAAAPIGPMVSRTPRRPRHKRHVSTAPIAMGIGVGVGATTAWVS